MPGGETGEGLFEVVTRVNVRGLYGASAGQDQDTGATADQQAAN